MDKKNKNSFRVPDSYFKDFNESLFKKLDMQSIENKTSDFAVPSDYFNTFNVTLPIEENKKTGAKKSKVIALFNQWQSLAALFIIGLTITLGYRYLTQTSASFDTLSSSDILYYMEQNTDMTAYEISEDLSITNLQEKVFSESIHTESLENYITNNINDFNFDTDE